MVPTPSKFVLSKRPVCSKDWSVSESVKAQRDDAYRKLRKQA